MSKGINPNVGAEHGLVPATASTGLSFSLSVRIHSSLLAIGERVLARAEAERGSELETITLKEFLFTMSRIYFLPSFVSLHVFFTVGGVICPL